MLVQKLRLIRGWSQQQLAELSGLSVRTIQRIERGQGASTESLKSLAAVFDVHFSMLIPESEMNDVSSQSPSTEEILAFQQVRKIRGFYVSLVQYVVVILVFTVLNLLTTPHYLWVIWMALGWGSGILARGLVVYGKIPFLGPKWEREKVETILGRNL